MPTVANRTVNTVGVVDDSAEARTNYEMTLEDANLQPVGESGPLGSLGEYVDNAIHRLDAVLCDHHLRISNYSTFDGAQLAAALYDKNLPAVLCTQWEEADLDMIRPYRNKIPALLQWEDLDPDTFLSALELTICELDGTFVPQRRPWRTQVHIADVGNDEFDAFFYVDLPSWTSSNKIRLRKASLGAELTQQLQVDARWHARVNLGAEDPWELYFQDWEPH